MADLYAIPTTIQAGDSYALLLSFSDYPATSGWALNLAVAGKIAKAWTSAAEGSSHRFTLTATETAALEAGSYSYRIRATDGTTATTVESGVITVLDDIGTFADGEGQPYAERMLAICQTARENILRGELKLYMIGGRQVQLHTLAEVAREEAHWRSQVARKARGSAFGKISVGFTR